MSYRMLTTLALLIASLMNPITSLAAADNPSAKIQAYKQSIKHHRCVDFWQMLLGIC